MILSEGRLNRIIQEAVNEIKLGDMIGAGLGKMFPNAMLKNEVINDSWTLGHEVIIDYEQKLKANKGVYEKHPNEVYIEIHPYFNGKAKGWIRKKQDGKVDMHQLKYFVTDKIAFERAAKTHGWSGTDKKRVNWGKSYPTGYLTHMGNHMGQKKQLKENIFTQQDKVYPPTEKEKLILAYIQKNKSKELFMMGGLEWVLNNGMTISVCITTQQKNRWCVDGDSVPEEINMKMVEPEVIIQLLNI